MLFVLTGDVQTGKTRWLLQLVDELSSRNVVPYGVIAPGMWADRRGQTQPSEHVDANGFEKLGIDNVLLPERRCVPFARRADLAQRDGSFDAAAQSAQAQLSWHISDEALDQVNAHFARILQLMNAAGCSDAGQSTVMAPGLLVVDELGRLELLHGGGLVQALAVLDRGAAPMLAHALVVVRESLLSHLEGRFGNWEKRRFIRPDDASAALVLSAFEE